MDNILLWDVDGVTKNLTTLDDFSKITSAMVSATSPTTTKIHKASSHSRPDWITEGDLIRGISSTDGVTITFVDNNYLGIYLGKCTNNQGNTFYGIQIKNKVADTNIETEGGDPPINYNMDFYLGVILDRTNERAYLMYCWDKYNSGSNNYYRVYIVTAMYNGTDLLWETFKNGYQPKYTSNGGGATHIAKVTGQLKDLSSNLSDILMVSGGGGGGLLVNTTEYTGKEAGGISGSGDNSADQTTGNAFGQGESGTNVSGGGSGLYGGYKGTSSKSGGAGSGYIGNSLLSNKKMVGYNVPTSSAESTKTESVNDVSASAVSGKPKSGNGFARIKFLYNPYRSIDKPLPGNIKVAKFAEGYEYYYGRQEVPTGQQYYDISDATPITLERGGSQSFSFGDLPAAFGIYDPNSSNVVNWYLREQTSSGRTMLLNNAWTGSFSADGNYTFYIIAGGEPSDLTNGKGYFTVIRTTDWSNGWGGLGFSNDILQQLKDYFL